MLLHLEMLQDSETISESERLTTISAQAATEGWRQRVTQRTTQ